MRTELRIEIERVETNLLTEFWKWGRTSDIRTRQALGDTAALSERLLNAEDRISVLERKRAS
ncbi:MAG TPA: hypothetical protein VFC21_12965 [Bryobacteraceae bacterium]|nr:hypothetical protein [Bryobacteraceae bacterium]